ncbi:MAG TPA: sensor histidine kinase [Longimicrobium sp.]|nr:sensor histidine kinase [Longimicrobium sp.]
MPTSPALSLPATAAPPAEGDGGRDALVFGLPVPVWKLIIGFWTMMAALDCVKSYFTPNAPGIPWHRVMVENFQWWYTWIPFAPLAFWLTRRYPPGVGRAAWNTALHVVFSIAVGLAHTVVGAFGFVFFTGIPFQRFGVTLGRMVALFWMSGIVVYWAMVGTFAALDYHRRLRDRELEAARLAARAAQLEASVTQARLDALRMELNPHFLFNTLNSVAGLARRGDGDAAVEVLATLGELLRITLGQRAQEVPLAEELDFLRRYLQIERVRFHDRLTVEMDVPAELLHLAVPSLVLQPLVENAVRHGVAKSPGPGRVAVRAFRDGESLVLEVSDTGAGFDGERRSGGVGLANVAERLAQLYGARAALACGNLPGGGARVTVTLPVHGEEADHVIAR